MSFILDALRKSETARRRSEAPDLFSAMPTTFEPERARPSWPLMAIGAIGIVSLLAALWLFVQRPQPAQASSVAQAADTTLNPTASPTTAEPLPPPHLAEQPAATTATADTLPVRETIQQATPVVAVEAPERPALQPPPTTLPAKPEPLQMSTAQPLSPPSSPLAASASDQPIALADLEPGTRSLLPPLKMSMHLWNETPSQRFVILDGQRLREGDLLGDIVIESITRNGTVLAWRGSRIKIELR